MSGQKTDFLSLTNSRRFNVFLDTPPNPAPKAIGSLAKKQADVTRQGTQKLKFVPTLPQRRKKE